MLGIGKLKKLKKDYYDKHCKEKLFTPSLFLLFYSTFSMISMIDVGSVSDMGGSGNAGCGNEG